MIPLDARLGLPEGEFSYLLQDWAQATCVQNAYGKSRDLLARILGLGLTVRSLEHMNVQMAEDVASFHTMESVPPEMMTKHALRGSRRQRLRSVITYFQNNRQYMQYDEYLRAGFPIGSGVAEGACRHLVKDRMELTGMRWRVEGAQAMLHLRAIYLNEQWNDLNDHRAHEEQERLYPFRPFVNREWREAA